jgi:hypothetical protein
MTAPFERFLGVDWSGAKSEDEPVMLAIAEAVRGGTPQLVVPTQPRAVRTRKWSRAQARALLEQRLAVDQPRTLVAIDMAVGLPWGSDRALFGVQGWRALVDAMAAEHAKANIQGTVGSARSTGERINARFPDGAPFRTDETRNDGRFYRDHHVAYYRQVESLVPQAISPWYLGSGGKVGYHTISGMFTLSRLLAARDRGALAFHVWPHEGLALPADGHVIAECYPAAMGAKRRDVVAGTTGDEHDALAIVAWLLDRDDDGSLAARFELDEVGFGRVDGVSWREQVEFEGWILGM